MEEEKEEMLSMKQVEAIKEMQIDGSGPSEISEKLSLDRKTVSKYMKYENFTPEISLKREYPSKLDKWKPKIDEWLKEDRKMRFKQRHTAKRVHERLKEEYGDEYDCSYPLIQRYCKKKKEDLKKNKKGFLDLIWHPGEAQVDFGEADFYEQDVFKAMKYLCISFPYSNAAYTQLFGGETAECVIQGLQDVFHRIGGVPLRLVFDNASGVGKRIGNKIQLSELFSRFKCHYGFDVSICNPYSGHEKGNVEKKVGYIRKNFFVPVPRFDDIEEYNLELLNRSEKDWDRNHYKKQTTISNLFSEEKLTLSPLPAKKFNAVRYEKIRTDGYGKFCLDGRHWYSSAPENGHGEIIVSIGAHHIEVLDESGYMITQHRRIYGNDRTESVDWSTSVERLFRNPGSWKNSGIREIISDELRDNMDKMGPVELKNSLRVLRDLSDKYDFETVIHAMSEAVNRETVDSYSVSAIAARILNIGLDIVPEAGPDMNSYDNELLKTGVENQ